MYSQITIDNLNQTLILPSMDGIRWELLQMWFGILFFYRVCTGSIFSLHKRKYFPVALTIHCFYSLWVKYMVSAIWPLWPAHSVHYLFYYLLSWVSQHPFQLSVVWSGLTTNEGYEWEKEILLQKSVKWLSVPLCCFPFRICPYNQPHISLPENICLENKMANLDLMFTTASAVWGVQSE